MRRYKTIILQDIIMPINNDDDGTGKRIHFKLKNGEDDRKKVKVEKLGYYQLLRTYNSTLLLICDLYTTQ